MGGEVGEVTKRILKILYAIENCQVLSAIKKGFLLIIPIVLTGSFALLLLNLPIPAYQGFLESLCDGQIGRAHV